MALPGVLTFTTNTIVAMGLHKQSLDMEFKEMVPATKRRNNPFGSRLPKPKDSVVSLDLHPHKLSHAPTLLQTGDFSDCTIIAGHREFRLHKNIVCYASAFFMKAFTSGMLETTSARIELRDEAEHPNDIGRMLKFMYETNYRSPDESKALTGCHHVDYSNARGANHPQLVQLVIDHVWLDIRMYSLGNKYLIPALKEFALAQFVGNLECELLHPSRALRLVPGCSTVVFTPDCPNTVPTILDLVRRTHIENEDLSPAHADAVFDFVYGMYPCLSKYAEFREALSGELAMLAAKILWRATPVRAEKLIENCCKCNGELQHECALEMGSFCHDCKVARRVEDMAVDPRAFEVPWADS